MVGIVASLLGKHWFATGDRALEMLRISDVGGSHTPLVGAWSRWGWAHPGPWLFWLLAPFYRVFGETGVLTGTAILNLVCMVAVVLLAYRRGATRLAVLTGLMVVLLAHGTGPLLIDPWNPWAAFFPFVVFLLLVWSVLCGDLVMLPIAVAIGSFSVQTHAGYLPLVGGLLVIALAWCVVPLVRHRPRGGFRRAPAVRWLVVSVGTGVLVWGPAIVDQLTGGNNLRTLIAYSRHPGEPSAGWHLAIETMGLELRPNGAWITGHDTGGLGFTMASPSWPGLLMLATVVIAGIVAWRRGRGDAARLALVAGSAAVLAVFSTARVTGIFVPYVMHWWWGVAALSTLSVVWCVAGDVGAPPDRDIGVLHRCDVVSTAGLVVLAVAVALLLRDLPTPLPGGDLSTTIATIGPPTAAALDHQDRYLVRGFDPNTWDSATNGVYFELARRGFHVFVDPDQFSALRFGAWREARPADVDGMVMIADIPDVDANVVDLPAGGRLVASFDPLAAAQRARYRELDTSIRALLGASAPRGRIALGYYDILSMQDAGVPESMLKELLALEQVGEGYEVFVTPPPAA